MGGRQQELGQSCRYDALVLVRCVFRITCVCTVLCGLTQKFRLLHQRTQWPPTRPEPPAMVSAHPPPNWT